MKTTQPKKREATDDEPASTAAAARVEANAKAKTTAAVARAAAERILQGEGAWVWQSEQLLWQGSEVELAHAGQLLRLDRLVQHTDRGWWVLDYKSAARPETQPELVAQMQAYRRAVQAWQGGSPVRAAFLTGQGTLVEVADFTDLPAT